MKSIIYILLLLFATKTVAQQKTIGFLKIIAKKTKAPITQATLTNLSTGETYNADQLGIIKVSLRAASLNYIINAQGYIAQNGYTKIKNKQEIKITCELIKTDTINSFPEVNNTEKSFEINGFVYEYGTGLPLKNCTVTIDFDSTLVKTNAKGFYTYASKKTIPKLKKGSKNNTTKITFFVKSHQTLIKYNIPILPTATRYNVYLKKGFGIVEEKNN